MSKQPEVVPRSPLSVVVGTIRSLSLSCQLGAGEDASIGNSRKKRRKRVSGHDEQPGSKIFKVSRFAHRSSDSVNFEGAAKVISAREVELNKEDTGHITSPNTQILSIAEARPSGATPSDVQRVAPDRGPLGTTTVQSTDNVTNPANQSGYQSEPNQSGCDDRRLHFTIREVVSARARGKNEQAEDHVIRGYPDPECRLSSRREGAFVPAISESFPCFPVFADNLGPVYRPFDVQQKSERSSSSRQLKGHSLRKSHEQLDGTRESFTAAVPNIIPSNKSNAVAASARRAFLSDESRDRGKSADLGLPSLLSSERHQYTPCFFQPCDPQHSDHEPDRTKVRCGGGSLPSSVSVGSSRRGTCKIGDGPTASPKSVCLWYEERTPVIDLVWIPNTQPDRECPNTIYSWQKTVQQQARNDKSVLPSKILKQKSQITSPNRQILSIAEARPSGATPSDVQRVAPDRGPLGTTTVQSTDNVTNPANQSGYQSEPNQSGCDDRRLHFTIREVVSARARGKNEQGEDHVIRGYPDPECRLSSRREGAFVPAISESFPCFPVFADNLGPVYRPFDVQQKSERSSSSRQLKGHSLRKSHEQLDGTRESFTAAVPNIIPSNKSNAVAASARRAFLSDESRDRGKSADLGLPSLLSSERHQYTPCFFQPCDPQHSDHEPDRTKVRCGGGSLPSSVSVGSSRRGTCKIGDGPTASPKSVCLWYEERTPVIDLVWIPDTQPDRECPNTIYSWQKTKEETLQVLLLWHSSLGLDNPTCPAIAAHIYCRRLGTLQVTTSEKLVQSSMFGARVLMAASLWVAAKLVESSMKIPKASQIARTAGVTAHSLTDAEIPLLDALQWNLIQYQPCNETSDNVTGVRKSHPIKRARS